MYKSEINTLVRYIDPSKQARQMSNWILEL